MVLSTRDKSMNERSSVEAMIECNESHALSCVERCPKC